MKGAYFWLSVFFVVYCARPEDWVPGLRYIPLAKISGLFALLGLLLSLGAGKRSLRSLPREAFYLFFLTALLLVSALLSPVWKGGAFSHSLDFSKMLVAWTLTFLVVTTLARLRRIIFIQAASVAVISIVSIAKGHSHPRLDGVLGGIYSNPNDLAFAIVLSLPFCLAFLVTSDSFLKKAGWTVGMLGMAAALFLTASRAGFITLVVAGAVCLWHIAIKGKRMYLLVAVGVIGLTLITIGGGQLKDRFLAISGEGLQTQTENRAYGSYEQRRLLIFKSLEILKRYPLFGVGVHNFANYSGTWVEVHVAYLQIAVEGGIPALIMYLLFFHRGFWNLKRVRRMRWIDAETRLLAGALHSSLVGFAVGALFAPEAYQYFPYFAVAYTAALLRLSEQQKTVENSASPAVPGRDLRWHRERKS
jgi:O-antigen ligase